MVVPFSVAAAIANFLLRGPGFMITALFSIHKESMNSFSFNLQPDSCNVS